MGNLITYAEGSNLTSFLSPAAATIRNYKIYFNPIQAGSGDASPTNIRNISGWTNIESTYTNKNLLNLEEYVTGKTGITVANGWINGTAYNLSAQVLGPVPNIYIPSGTEFTVSFKAYTDNNANDNNTGLSIYISDGEGHEAEIGNLNNLRDIANKDAKVTCSYHTWEHDVKQITFGYYQAPENIWHISEFQIELGSIATQYEEGKKNSYPINWQSIAGTIYGGYPCVVFIFVS